MSKVLAYFLDDIISFVVGKLTDIIKVHNEIEKLDLPSFIPDRSVVDGCA